MISAQWGGGKMLLAACFLYSGTASTPNVAAANAVVGSPAPNFSAKDIEGKTQTLDAWRGRVVVLEWVNPECPFVRKHYGSGNMQRLQRKWIGQGVAWLSVNSSAVGKQGHLTPATAKAFLAAQHAAPTQLLLDPDGVVGRLYGAKTTPHLFIIDQHGVLVYAGAIDDQPSTNPADIEGATNYADNALGEVLANKPVSISETRSYGCSVKY